MTRLNRFVITFLCCWGIISINAQKLHTAYGPNYTLSKMKVPLVNGKDWLDNTDFSFKFSLELPLKITKIKTTSIAFNYTQYDGATNIPFERGSVLDPAGFPIIGVGFVGINAHNFTTSLKWDVFQPSSKYFISPYAGFGIQISKWNGWEYWDTNNIIGPDYVQTSPIQVESLNTIQPIPTIGLKSGIVFWKRLELGLDVQGVYAFKSYQNMYLDYEYLGEPQPTAVYETTGTGVFTAIFLGYRIKKLSR